MRKPKLSEKSERVGGVIIQNLLGTKIWTEDYDDCIAVCIDDLEPSSGSVPDVLAAIRDAGADPVFAAVENLIQKEAPNSEALELLRQAYLDATEESD